MKYIKSTKPYNKDKRNILIVRIIIGAICLITILTIFMNIFNITTVFNTIYKEHYEDYLKEMFGEGYNNLGGLTTTIKGYEIAFGITNKKFPIQLPAEPIVAVCFFAILFFGLFAIPFGKLEKNKLFSTIRYALSGIGLITFSIIYLLFLDGASKELEATLTYSDATTQQIFKEATVKINDFNAICFFMIIIAGFMFFYLSIKSYTKKNLYKH